MTASHLPFIVVVAAFCTSTRPGVAFADDRDPGPANTATVSAEARRLFDQGKRQMEARDYDAAVRSFRESYARYPAPGLLYSMAQAYRLKGDCVAALSFYRQYLPVAPADKNLREKTEARIVDMERCTVARPPAAATAATPATARPAQSKTSAPPAARASAAPAPARAATER